MGAGGYRKGVGCLKIVERHVRVKEKCRKVLM